jgi:glycerol kinase
VVTYNRDQWSRRSFDILIDGEKLASQLIEARCKPEFFDAVYPLSETMAKGKVKATVRFQAIAGDEIAAVFGIRVLRRDAGDP